MKLLLLLFLITPLFVWGNITIVDNQKGVAQIVYSTKNNQAKEIVHLYKSSKDSALRLAQYIKEVTSAKLEVKEKSTSKVQIQLKIADKNVMDVDAFTITFPNKNTIVLTGGSPRGLDYACSEFLERYLGIRWLFPGPLGTYIPKKKTITIETKDISSTPSFARRFLGAGSLRNKTAAVYYHWMLNLRGNFHERYNCFHNLWNIVPVKLYGKTNPDFYPIINGKRFIPSEKENIWWQPCFTSKNIVAAALKNIKEDAVTCSLAVNDGGKHCECQKCLAIDKGKNYLNRPNRSATYLEFCKQIALQRPNTLFGVSAYADVAEAPNNIKLPKNIIPELTYDSFQRLDKNRAKFTENLLDRWNKICSGPLGWYDYVYGQTYAFPRIYTRHLAKQIKFLHSKNVRYLSGEYYPNGNYHDAIKVYVYLKLAWNINQNVDAIIDDWCLHAVGAKAAPYLKAYFDCIEKYWTSPEVRETPWFKNQWTYLNWGDSTYLDAMPISMIDECEKLLTQTLKYTNHKQRAQYFLNSFLALKPKVLAYKKNQQLRNIGKKLVFDRLLFDGDVNKSSAGFSKWQESKTRGKMYYSKDEGINKTGSLVIDLNKSQRLSLCWLKGLAATPGKIYKATFFFKEENVDVGTSISLSVRYQKNNRWMDSSFNCSSSYIATEEQGKWKKVEIYSKAPEVAGTTLILVMGVGKSNNGKVFFDNITIKTANYTASELALWQKTNFNKTILLYNFNTPKTIWAKSGKNIFRTEKDGLNNTPALIVGNSSTALNFFKFPGKGKRKVKVSGFYKGDALKLTIKWQSSKPAWLSENLTSSAIFPSTKD